MDDALRSDPAAQDPLAVVSDPGSHRRFVELIHDLDAVFWEMDPQTWRFTYVTPRALTVFGIR